MSRPHREVFGVKISTDQGKHWRTIAVCLICEGQIEKTALFERGTAAGVRSCDWCGAINSNEYADPAAARPQSIISKDGLHSGASFASIGELLARGTILAGANQDLAAEDLPKESVMLEVEYSPIIPYPFGKLESAVEAVKISDYSYQFEYQNQIYAVSDEQLKEMRARYLVAYKTSAKACLRQNNPEGSIWHEIGSR